MEGLLLRLTQLDAVAENAVRVIGFFDQLTTRRVSLETLVAEASRLAECPVGLVTDDCPAPEKAIVHVLADGTGAWLSRVDSIAPLDDILVERLAMSASILWRHDGSLVGPSDAELVRTYLSEASSAADRSRASSLLGFDPDALVSVVALDVGRDAVVEIAESLRGRYADIGSLHAVLTASASLDLGSDVRAGVSPAMAVLDGPTAWRRARTAMRMARAARRIVYWKDLGSLAPIIERLRLEDIDDVPDVVTLDLIEAAAGGPDTMDILTAFCASDSVRHTAAAVYRHHSTVASRLAQIGDRMGFCLTTVEGKERLRLALLLRYLRGSVA
ncbi:helix-turn-helix domain-containing protein [Rhodococcoides yunnanense]|uniref:helix-turn-helix domain-containing protein n=1 Tax=Rhodococcoides yunnanense TaxID=278209 RepID=UPI000932432E|nr:helix-turn-helix domain-containing protein [Rhodococcus yunnanensis]